MPTENFPVEIAIFSVAAVAAIALLINIKFKLPKKIFLSLAILMVLLIVWYSMGGTLPKSVKSIVPAQSENLPKTVSRIRAASFDTFHIGGNSEIPLHEKSEKIISLRAFISAPQNISNEDAKNFTFSLVKKDGTEIRNLGVTIRADMIPAKVSAIFRFDDKEDISNFSALKISTSNIPAYDAKGGLLLETISEKED